MSSNRIATVTKAPRRSDRFLKAIERFPVVVMVTHINPDPDALASMFGLKALIERVTPGRRVVLTLDGMLARAENRSMVELLEVPLAAVDEAPRGSDVATVMVDSQPLTGRRGSEAVTPTAVLDHHRTGGSLTGVRYQDIRPDLGATATMVTGYLMEQEVPVGDRLATALFYGIDSESSGYPREAGPADDGALVWLFPRADKDLLARIRNPRLPLSYFATAQHALANAFLYEDVLVCWCGEVPQPDILAELADFFVRLDQVRWVVSIGLFEDHLRLSARINEVRGQGGEVLRDVLEDLGQAGGHDQRAGGAIPLSDRSPETIDRLLHQIRQRLLARLEIDEARGRRLLEACPVIEVP